MEKKKKTIYEKYVKRFLDFTVSLLALIILCPILVIVMILVRINLGSPVFFKQQRPGKDGKIFSLIKFRTMKDAVDRNGNKLNDEQRLKIIAEKGEDYVSSDAERLTKFGKLLRKLSIDELPELINILKGEMSIVGPRPLAVIYLPYYNEKEMHRHDALPGLTGLAQVNGRNIISWDKRFQYDLEYVNNITFRNDLHILFRTVAVVFEHSDIGQGEERPEAFNIVRQRELESKKTVAEKGI